jgi:SnoaL-like domain
VEDAVTRYCRASEAKDMDALVATLAPDVELFSPIFANAVFRGRDDLRTLLTPIYATLEGWRWGDPIGEGSSRVVIGEGRIIGLRLGDAMVFDLAEDGQIARIRPHLRPWLATTAFALVLGAKLAPRLDVVGRALRAR